MRVYGLYVPLQNPCFHKDILTVLEVWFFKITWRQMNYLSYS